MKNFKYKVVDKEKQEVCEEFAQIKEKILPYAQKSHRAEDLWLV